MTKPKGSMPQTKKRGNRTDMQRVKRMLEDAKKRKREVAPGLYLQQVR